MGLTLASNPTALCPPPPVVQYGPEKAAGSAARQNPGVLGEPSSRRTLEQRQFRTYSEPAIAHSVSEIKFPSGSLNHATRAAPSGEAHTPPLVLLQERVSPYGAVGDRRNMATTASPRAVPV